MNMNGKALKIMAGIGKSEILKETQRILNNRIRQCITAAPTHKAYKPISGNTIHKIFDINPIDYTYSYKKVTELKDDGIQYILVDEISMISERLWGILAILKKEFEMDIYHKMYFFYMKKGDKNNMVVCWWTIQNSWL